MTSGWGTLAYGLVAGLSAGVAAVFLLIGTQRRRLDRLMASFGLYSLAIAAGTVVTVRMHQSSTVVEYRTWFKLFGLTSLMTLAVLVVLFAAWTRQVSRRALIVFGVATVVVGVFSVVLPNGLLQGEIVGLRDVTLFGERFVVHEGTASRWRPVLDVYLLATAAYLVYALVSGFRSGRGAISAIMALALIIGAIVGAYDSGVDYGVFDTPYLTPFGYLGMAVVGVLFLADRDGRAHERLRDHTTRLEEKVIERTAALLESNRRLETQLVRQRRSTDGIAALTEEFERSNAMVDPTPDAIEVALDSLLAQLGSILSAARLRLRVDDGRLDGMLPPDLIWQRPGAIDELDGDTEQSDVSEPIRVGGRTVGEVVVTGARDPSSGGDALQLLALTAEHLAGLIQRLILVGRMADTAVEAERRRIAMDLHDSVSQRMYAVSFLTDAAVHQAGVDPSRLDEPLRRIRELVLSSLAELRSLLVELRPQALDDATLPALIEQLADTVQATCDAEIVATTEPMVPLSPQVKTALYRISQEALGNACRHSGARRINVTLRQHAGTTILRVDDDGVGFDPDVRNGGSGLDNLRTRARFIGAEIEIASGRNGGTTIEVRSTPVSKTTDERVVL